MKLDPRISPHLRGQIYLGDADFAERMRARADPQARQSREVPVWQRITAARGPATWDAWLQAQDGRRAQALHVAYRAGWKTMPALAAACGLSVGQVSRLIRGWRRGWRGNERPDPLLANSSSRVLSSCSSSENCFNRSRIASQKARASASSSKPTTTSSAYLSP